jgi:hypothetical protein
MSNATYAGVTKLRFVQGTHSKGRTYYYFRRSFPIVRLPGEPSSELFTNLYNAALAATTREQFIALRSNMPQKRPRDPELYSPSTNAIMAWAKRGPITYAQATMVAQRFGVAIEEIVRGCEVLDNPKDQVLANKETRESVDFSKMHSAANTLTVCKP